MPTLTYQNRRSQLETYFDRTAAEAWKRLTSDAPVNRIRATVRAGRDRMRATMLSWLQDDLRGRRVLDAGCGTGAMAVELARRGAEVVAVDVAAGLVEMARERLPVDIGAAGGRVSFYVGDMLDPSYGGFDHVVAMDSLIHYEMDDAVRVLSELSRRVRYSMVFTFAPQTPALATMHAVGRLFPRGNRAPAIAPVSVSKLRRVLSHEPGLSRFEIGRSERVACGFYTSQAMELRSV